MISCNYKTYVKFIMNDSHLTIMGAIRSLMCRMSRFFMGDFDGENLFYVFAVAAACCKQFLVIYCVLYLEGAFHLSGICPRLTCYGGFLGIFPAIASKVFGFRYGSQIYGFLFYALQVSNFLQLLIINLIGTTLGYWFVFMISGGMSVCGLLLSNRITG